MLYILNRTLLICAAICFAVAPLIWAAVDAEPLSFEIKLVIITNVFGWVIVIISLVSNRLSEQKIRRYTLKAGIYTDERNGSRLLTLLLKDIARRERALSMPHLEKRIYTNEELAAALQEIVEIAHSLLHAESTELALFNTDENLYTTSFMKGRPFSVEAQAMLTKASSRMSGMINQGLMIYPVSFAGNVLGTLRVAIPNDRYPDSSDRKVVAILAAQAALAITNAQYTGQLLRLTKASEESLKAKTGFLANLSHEFRSPLGIILNGLEIILDKLCGEINSEQEETLNLIKDSSEHLLELVNDVLDYAKIESGKVLPEKTVIDLNPLLKDMCAVVRKQAEEKKHSLKFNEANESLFINCDKRHLRQILLNILTNAIKYTPENGLIEVSAERASGGRIKISVKDNGIGIAPHNQHKVFAPFERVQNTYALAQGGTGLGMPLTKSLVEMNGGRINLDSKVGQGTTVSVFFISASPSDLSEEISNEIEIQYRGNNEKVLIVSSVRHDGSVLEKYLTSIGYLVEVATSEEEAKSYLSNNLFNLILLDTDYLQGWILNCVEGIKNSARSERLPLLLHTGRAFAFDLQEFLRLGIDRCLIKPARLAKIGDAVRALIDNSYYGEVIDKAELENLELQEQEQNPIKSVTSSGKLVGVDDIIH